MAARLRWLYGRIHQTPFWLRWLLLCIWLILIFVVSGQPSDTIPKFGGIDALLKKSAHMAAYGWLALLAWFALAGRPHRVRWALLIAVAYAASDEFHQTFVPGRNGTLLDVGIDSAGALLALWLAQKLPEPSG